MSAFMTVCAEQHSLRSWPYCVGARLKFGGGAVFQKKGLGTRRLKYRLPENPGILKQIGQGPYIIMSIMLDDPSHIFPN